MIISKNYVPRTLFVYQKSTGYRYQRLNQLAKALYSAQFTAGWIEASRWKSGNNDYDLVVIQQDAIPFCEQALFLQKAPIIVDVHDFLDSTCIQNIHGAIIEHSAQIPLVAQLGKPYALLENYLDMSSQDLLRDFVVIGMLPGTITHADKHFITPVLHRVREMYPEVQFLLPAEFSPEEFETPVMSDDNYDLRSFLAEQMSIALLPATDVLYSRTLWPVLEYAQSQSAIVASPIYQTLIRSATTGAIATDTDDWFKKICRYIDEPGRRSVANAALYRALSTRYNSERGAYYGALMLQSLYSRIVGSFNKARAA